MFPSFSFICVAKKKIVPVLKYGFATAMNNHSGIENVTVLGGGLMGAGIAQVSAQNGFSVVVVDNDEYQQKCLVSVAKSLHIISKKRFPNDDSAANEWRSMVFRNIKTTNKMEAGCAHADLVIESVIEDIYVKKDIFKQIDGIIPKHAILGCNTSSLSIQELSNELSCVERFIGLHFFNPVWRMKLVEIIPIQETTKDTVDKAFSYVKEIGKVAVQCRDTPGFIVNQLLYPYFMEALRFMEEGHATITDIDAAMKLGAGLPKGPFELMDIIGVDTVQQVMKHWNHKYPGDPRFVPSDTINEMVRKMALGMKTHKGFYTYKHTLF